MQKTRSVSELIHHNSKALAQLRERLDERAQLLLQVRAALPTPLVACVLSAGLDKGVLTLGTASAAWASRLRYVSSQVIDKFAKDYDVKIARVRVKVVLPGR